jgi:hypothetical protein
MSNTFIIEWDSTAQTWVTYVWVAGIHDGDDPHLSKGTEEHHATIDGAARRIKVWKKIEALVARGAYPPPNPDRLILWEDYGEYHVETLAGQRTLISFNDALAMASLEVNIRNYMN